MRGAYYEVLALRQRPARAPTSQRRTFAKRTKNFEPHRDILSEPSIE
jgi:hypothetical protein